MENNGPIFENDESHKPKELDPSTRFMLRGPRLTATFLGSLIEFDAIPGNMTGRLVGFVATFGLIYVGAGVIIREMDSWPNG